MSLEKWLKPTKKVEKSEDNTKKKKEKNHVKIESPRKKNSELEITPKISVTKFKLECPKSTCKYKKIIIKKNLVDKDKICPRCKSKMKIK